MAKPAATSPSQRVDIHVGKEAPPSHGKEGAAENSYPQMPPRFIPKEGYELIGALVKVDPFLAKYLFKFLKGAELVPDEDSPTGYREKQLKGVVAFCNDDGVDKITDLILLHINTPLSYREKGQTVSQIAGQVAKQFIKDTAANFERWQIRNPSLIPQISALVFQYIKASQGQSTELPDALLSGGALRPKAAEPQMQTKPKNRISI